jgi:hypothetical protein
VYTAGLRIQLTWIEPYITANSSKAILKPTVPEMYGGKENLHAVELLAVMSGLPLQSKRRG